MIPNLRCQSLSEPGVLGLTEIHKISVRLGLLCQVMSCLCSKESKALAALSSANAQYTMLAGKARISSQVSGALFATQFITQLYECCSIKFSVIVFLLTSVELQDNGCCLSSRSSKIHSCFPTHASSACRARTARGLILR